MEGVEVEEPGAVERSAEAASVLGLETGCGTEGEDGMAEWHGPGGPGGELRNDPRRPIQRSTTQRRSQSRS